MRKIVVLLALLCVLLLPNLVHAPIIHRTLTTPTAIVQPIQPLSMKLLGVTINGCSQVGNVNATWTGTGYYPLSPSSFVLISTTTNAIYANNTDIAYPNEQNTWILFQNVPITLRVSFEFCSSPSTETLVYTDGVYTFVLS